MSRNIVARPLLTVGLLAASLAWLGFTMQRTAFDATRSERAVGVLLDDRAVREALLQRLASSVDEQLPPTVRGQITSEQLGTVAASTLDDPTVRDALLTAIGGTHRYLLGETESAPVIDEKLVDAVLRRQLTSVRPDLATVVPSLPAFEITLPTAGLAPVRAVHSWVDRLTPLAAMVALGCVLASLALSSTRPRVLRRVGWWAMTTGAIWVGFRYLLPAITKAVLPSGAALVSGLTDALVGAIMRPGVVLAAAGAMTWLAGFVLARVEAGDLGGGRDASIGAEQASRDRARARASRTRAQAAARRADGGLLPTGGSSAAAGVTTGATSGDRRQGSRWGRNGVVTPVSPVRAGANNDAGLYVPPPGARSGGASGRPMSDPTAIFPPVDGHTTPSAPPVPPSVAARADTSDHPTTFPLGPSAAAPTITTGAEYGTSRVALPTGGVPLPKRSRPTETPEAATGGAEQPGAGPDQFENQFANQFSGAAPARGELPGANGAVGTGVFSATGDPGRHAGEWLGGFSLDPDQHRPVAQPAPPPPRWVQGVGYVYDEPPTANARWVDGLGYVLDDV